MTYNVPTTPIGVSKTPEQNSSLIDDGRSDAPTIVGQGCLEATSDIASEAEGAVSHKRLSACKPPHYVASTDEVFIINGVSHPSIDMPCTWEWLDAAFDKGFFIAGRAKDRHHLVLQCFDCGELSLVRSNVVREHKVLCHHCIHTRKVDAARAIGARLLDRDPNNRKIYQVRLACGHIVLSQSIRVEKAAAGGFSIGCKTCRETRYRNEAKPFGWTPVGAAESKKSGYRNYRHTCGHTQDVMIGNMLWGDCTCASCGTGWSAKASYVYLFRIPLEGLPVLKLGYSARPAKRLRHQLGIDLSVDAEVLRVVAIPNGNRAVAEESACHRHMAMQHPNLVVPKAEFGDRINTLGEIYREGAEDILNALLDDIAVRYSKS